MNEARGKLVSSEEKPSLHQLSEMLIEEKERESNYDEEIKLVYNADDKNIKETKITIDLYIKDKKTQHF